MTEKRPVIIDLGPDDASLGLAAILASPEVEVRGFTFTDGPQCRAFRELDERFKLAKRAPVGFGEALPIRAGVPSSLAAAEGSSAHRLIYDQSGLCGGRLEILALGPLTNLAKAILAHPGTIRGIRRVVFGGGARGAGNATPAAERNVHADASAAKVVFESGLSVVMVGLDVAQAARLSPAEAHGLSSRAASEHGILQPSRVSGDGFVDAQDLAAALALLDADFLYLRECRVDIETRGEVTYGKTVCDLDGVSHGKPNARIALGLDRERYIERARTLLR